MDFADEHYVKLFTRDTVTWKSWSWQARTVLTLLLRKVDAAGFLDIGRLEPAAAVSIMVDLPREVAEPGLNDLMADGTAELVDRRLLLPNFVSAQESRKTDKAKARDYRERKKVDAREAATSKSAKLQDSTVTARHPSSPAVTPTNPPALPCPALPCPEQPSAPRKRVAGKPPADKDTKPPDPRLHPLRLELERVYLEKKHAEYPFDYGYELKVLQKLLARKPAAHDPALWVITLVGAWARALDATHPDFHNLEAFERDLPRYLGTGPPAKNAPPTRSEPVTYTEGRTHL